MTDEQRSDRVADGAEDVPEAVMGQVPRGALALAALTVALLLVAWLAMYLFVFIPRGAVS